MVTKSFGKRNFMQPMGRPKPAFKVPCYFFLSCFGGRGERERERFFCHFSCLPNVRSLQVPMMFPNFAMFSQHVFHSTSLLSQYALEKWCPPFTYIGGPKGRNYILENAAFCFGESS
jgi:hypothetical protein